MLGMISIFRVYESLISAGLKKKFSLFAEDSVLCSS